MGIIIGSFLNVCIYRIPRDQSIVYPSSHCCSCNISLKLLDLIPIFSYLFLKGKCRYCGAKISSRYPLLECLTGIIYSLLFLKYGLSPTFFFYILLASILLCIAFIDYDHQIIPDRLLILGFITGLCYKIVLFSFAEQPIEILNSFLGFFLGGGFFFLIATISNGGMGGGDIKLIAILGFWFGWKDIILISLLSFIIGSIIAILLLMMRLKTRKDAIPFGPFIVSSVLFIMLYKDLILSWYISLLIR